MSEETARNTQFAGYAKALMGELTAQDDLLDLNRDYDEAVVAKYEQIIARRAYDLSCHTVTHLDEDVFWRMGKGYTASQIVENDVPDMTELPKEQE